MNWISGATARSRKTFNFNYASFLSSEFITQLLFLIIVSVMELIPI